MADAVKEVMAAEAARQASGNTASSSKQASEQMVGQSDRQKLLLYAPDLIFMCFILRLLSQVKILETAMKSVAQQQKINEIRGTFMLVMLYHIHILQHQNSLPSDVEHH